MKNLERQVVKFSVAQCTLSGILAKPNANSKNLVLLLHPHPLYGGDMDNPVITSIDRLFLQYGFATFRFNFRGVSENNGFFEGLSGAVDDSSNAIEVIQSLGFHPYGVVGYSFGGSTALRLATKMSLNFLITLSASLSLFSEGEYHLTHLSKIRCPTLMFHGTSDRMIPFSDLEHLSVSIGQNVEAVQLPGEGHFYTQSVPYVLERIQTFIKNSNQR